jgi:hypothetical protein
LVETERSYVNDLKIIVDVIIKGLSEFMNKSEISRCFDNIYSIRKINEEMFNALTPWNPHKPLMLIITEYAPYFKMYFEYCNNYNNLIAIITKLKKENPKFLARIAELEKKPELRRLEIFSFLVKPI